MENNISRRSVLRAGAGLGVAGAVYGAAGAVLGAGAGPPSAAATVADPRNAVFDRTDLIYGSQYWWSKPPAQGSLAFSNGQAAKIRTVRFQDVEGSSNPALFTGGIKTLKAMGAVPFIGVPPIGNPNLPGGPYPWSYAMQQYTVQQAVALGAILFEMANEPDNYLGYSGTQYFSNLWVNVPKLKAYARSQLGTTIYFGGPATTGFCSAGGNLPWIETWLSLCTQKYKATGNRDWIPDYVTAHCYGGATNSPAGSISQAMTYLSTNFDKLRKYVNAMPGPVAGSTGSIIKLVNSEYDLGIQSTIGTQWENQTTMTNYFNSIFKMASSPNSVDGQQRVWEMNQFCLINGGDGLDLLNTDGTIRPAYKAFKADATAVPVQ